MVTLIYGKSGAGKSRSLKNMDRDKTLLISVQRKPLPFKGMFPMTYYPKGIGNVTQEITGVIKKALVRCPITSIVIDDAGYLMTKTFMANHKNRQGSASFDLYNDIADDFYSLINFCNTLPVEENVYIIMHEDANDYGVIKLKTIGQLLDQRVCIEGMVTVCLRAVTDGKAYWFETQNTGNDISKSPEGLFDSRTIDNDLAMVDSCIRDYYELPYTHEIPKMEIVENPVQTAEKVS